MSRARAVPGERAVRLLSAGSYISLLDMCTYCHSYPKSGHQDGDAKIICSAYDGHTIRKKSVARGLNERSESRMAERLVRLGHSFSCPKCSDTATSGKASSQATCHSLGERSYVTLSVKNRTGDHLHPTPTGSLACQCRYKLTFVHLAG